MHRVFGSILVRCFKIFLAFLAVLTITPAVNAKSGLTIQVAKIAVPRRYDAPLPTTMAELDLWAEGNDKFPPQTHVIDSLSFGQAAMFRRLEIASRAVPPDQREAWANRWYDLLEFYTVSPAFCALARPHMERDASALRLAIAGSFVRDCFKPDDRAMILRPDTLDRAVLDYFDVYKGPADHGIEVPYDDRLVSVVAAIITERQGFDQRRAAFALINQKNAKAESALIAIYRTLNDETRKDAVAAALTKGRSDEAKRISTEFCARRSNDAACSNIDPFVGYEPGEESPKASAGSIQTTKDRLVEMGFQNVARLDPKTVSADSAEVMLAEAGYAYGFDVETGTFPNGHDSLLRNLARLISPALNDAIFEEVAPPEDVGPYQIHAYVNGTRYSVKAENLGDWYDVASVFLLLDYILSDQNMKYALLPLPTNDQTLTIIGGPRSAIEQLLKSKLIKKGDVGRAEKLGKEFESKVFETLKGGNQG